MRKQILGIVGLIALAACGSNNVAADIVGPPHANPVVTVYADTALGSTMFHGFYLRSFHVLAVKITVFNTSGQPASGYNVSLSSSSLGEILHGFGGQYTITDTVALDSTGSYHALWMINAETWPYGGDSTVKITACYPAYSIPPVYSTSNTCNSESVADWKSQVALLGYSF